MYQEFVKSSIIDTNSRTVNFEVNYCIRERERERESESERERDACTVLRTGPRSLSCPGNVNNLISLKIDIL